MAMTDLKTLYEEDTVAWAENQAAALRAAAQGSSNQALDWENLAEEIDDLAKSQRRALRSQLSRILQHQVKLAHSPAIDPRKGWRLSILQARVEIEGILEESPSLKREVSRFIANAAQRAIDLAIAELEEHGELATTDVGALRANAALLLNSYTEDQILGDWFPPEPPKA
jgi:hypothetical protein